jgi:hypothetical protein
MQNRKKEFNEDIESLKIKTKLKLGKGKLSFSQIKIAV